MLPEAIVSKSIPRAFTTFTITAYKSFDKISNLFSNAITCGKSSPLCASYTLTRLSSVFAFTLHESLARSPILRVNFISCSRTILI